MQDEELKWLNAYADEVREVFDVRFESVVDRFKTPQKLLGRFTSAVKAVRAKEWSRFHSVYEAHNELCIAAAILGNQEPQFTCLEYELPLHGCGKVIDFLATCGDLKVYVDVKTIMPCPTDGWRQYEEFQAKGRFPGNVNLILERECLGDELWHNMYAARGRMLEHSLELEQKIAEGNLSEGNTRFVLAFCGEGYHWGEDELDDFVSYYYSGAHRGDDPFSKMEAWDIQHKHIAIARTISCFACMRRSVWDVLPQRLNWNVQPPPRAHLS